MNRYNDPWQMENTAASSPDRVAMFLSRVMLWMFAGLLVSACTAVACFNLPGFLSFLLTNFPLVFGITFVIELVIVLSFRRAVASASAGTVTAMFFIYAVTTGALFSILGLNYNVTSIILVFGLTGFIFLAMSVYGFLTKKDLTSIGRLALFALLGIILGGLINLFLRNSMLDFIVTTVGIVVFIALIAYDTQRIKNVYYEATQSGYDDASDEIMKFAVYGAFHLYLDFINLFLKLLRLMGNRRR